MANCKHCGKELKGDKRKVFCSNKGAGNHKDAYHNRTEGRISRSRFMTGSQPSLEDFEDEFEGDDDPSWDAHKDSW